MKQRDGPIGLHPSLLFHILVHILKDDHIVLNTKNTKVLKLYIVQRNLKLLSNTITGKITGRNNNKYIKSQKSGNIIYNNG